MPHQRTSNTAATRAPTTNFIPFIHPWHCAVCASSPQYNVCIRMHIWFCCRCAVCMCMGMVCSAPHSHTVGIAVVYDKNTRTHKQTYTHTGRVSSLSGALRLSQLQCETTIRMHNHKTHNGAHQYAAEYGMEKKKKTFGIYSHCIYRPRLRPRWRRVRFTTEQIY